MNLDTDNFSFEGKAKIAFELMLNIQKQGNYDEHLNKMKVKLRQKLRNSKRNNNLTFD